MTSDAKHDGSARTNGDGADRTITVRLLNGALATEIVCVLRYQRHYFMARRLQAQTAARKLLAYANEEQRHAELIAARITQLGGTLIFSPAGLLSVDHSAHGEQKDLLEMIREDLGSERVCIEAYREMLRGLGNDDPTSRQLVEEILANEEQHAGDLMALIDILRREEQSGFVGDRPRRVDASIDYFGTR